VNRDTAIRKILACLRLAKSCNPNEAAAALRQARTMMETYGLTEDDALAEGIREADAKTPHRGAMVPRSVLWLASLVADGYRCRPVVRREQRYTRSFSRSGTTAIRFFGTAADAQIAAYAFTVLARQLSAAKSKHTRRIRKKANKERRGEEFALGWVSAVEALFPAQELADDHGSAIAAAMRARMPGATTTTGREIAKPARANPNDHWAGYDAGRKAQLHQGLGENAQRRLESAQ
jgi:hypothetical protein